MKLGTIVRWEHYGCDASSVCMMQWNKLHEGSEFGETDELCQIYSICLTPLDNCSSMLVHSYQFFSIPNTNVYRTQHFVLL